MRGLLVKVAFVMSLLVLWACEHKELCYTHPHSPAVRVVFDWQLLEEAMRPTAMRVAFYPIQGGEPLLFDFSDPQGGRIELPDGGYRVLCHNNDTEWIGWQGMSDFLTLRASTDPIQAPDGTVAFSTPDFLCVGREDHVWISSIDEEQEQVVCLTPQRATSRYSFEVNGLKGLERLADFRGMLSGMSAQLYVATDSLPEKAQDRLLFGGQRMGDQLQGVFQTFGYSTPDSLLFTLFLRDAKGQMHRFQQDVGDQIRSFPREGHVGDVHVVLRFDFTLPTDSVGGGGFDVDADEWEDVHIDIDV